LTVRRGGCGAAGRHGGPGEEAAQEDQRDQQPHGQPPQAQDRGGEAQVRRKGQSQEIFFFHLN